MSQTKLAAPISLAPRKHDSLTFCVEYWKKNLFREIDYPTPRIGKCIQSLVEVSVFYEVDATSGYWEVHIGDED